MAHALQVWALNVLVGGGRHKRKRSLTAYPIQVHISFSFIAKNSYFSFIEEKLTASYFYNVEVLKCHGDITSTQYP